VKFVRPLESLRRRIAGYASAVFLPQVPGTLHSNWPDFLQRKSVFKLFFHRFKRALYLRVTGQNKLLAPKIPQASRHILWVYLGMPQLGDSIMDLSARVLFSGAHFKVDLYSVENIAALYRDDPFFATTYSDATTLDFKKYDFVLLQALSWKCMKFKARHLPEQKFLALQGYYYGPEFNRLEYGYNAVSYYGDFAAVAAGSIKPVFNLKLDHSATRRQQNTIALVLGGVAEYRTYTHWEKFVALVLENESETDIVLIGSANGRDFAENLARKFSHLGRIRNEVGTQTIPEVFAQICDAALLVCADGGLMHLGRASQTPILALLAGPIHPLMRFSPGECATAMHAPERVSDISPAQVFDEYLKIRNHSDAGLSCVYLGQKPCCTTQQSLTKPS
jgi:heptosyltransferase-2